MINIFWFRRDLRFFDNTALSFALDAGLPVLPVFIFDDAILNNLEDKKDARVTFIHDTIGALKKYCAKKGSDVLVMHGKPFNIFEKLLDTYNVHSIFTNRDYEPYAILRDGIIKELCEQKGVQFFDFKDQVIFEKNEVVKENGQPYTVFTPYKKKWLEKFQKEYGASWKPIDSESGLSTSLIKSETPHPMISLENLGFERSDITIPTKELNHHIIQSYDTTRDFPFQDATSKLGIHFRFGTISIRENATKAAFLNQTYLNELIWRDFYAMILWFFPKVVNGAFRSEYDFIVWEINENHFEAWCQGKTGYPLVDAGMRQLVATGYMHNRVRMVVASFLTKHLLIDWRWGEAWFARHLLDFDLASNNGGWQWAAGCGTDAAPYFRIFNPTTQQEKFDKNFEYIKKWIPEYGTSQYPKPIVDHATAREKCLRIYKEGLSNR